jgi:polysaccharide pyruvyl transferase WcaK-like protein
MRKVAVLCWAGHRNFGDELILAGLKQLFKGWQVTPMTNDITGTYPLVDFDEINNCDLMVVGGGELIHANRLFTYYPAKLKGKLFRLYARTPLAYRSWVSHIKIPKIILGCGVNVRKASDLNDYVISELEQFNYIGLRDKASVEILQSYPQLKNKTELFHDLGFQAELPKEKSSRNNDLAVVIPTERTNLNVIEHSQKWLKRSLRPYKQVYFLPFGQIDNNDYSTCKQLAYDVRGSVILEPAQLTLANTFDLVSTCQKVFAYRLHGLILAFLAGVKYQYYPYHRKLQRVHETLLGLNPDVIRVGQKQQFDEVLEAALN